MDGIPCESLSQKDALDCVLPPLNGDGADLPYMYSEATEANAAFPSKEKPHGEKLQRQGMVNPL
jgi:1,4-dihydroxy-2-naphthoyl-CoA synthase